MYTYDGLHWPHDSTLRNSNIRCLLFVLPASSSIPFDLGKTLLEKHEALSEITHNFLSIHFNHQFENRSSISIKFVLGTAYYQPLYKNLYSNRHVLFPLIISSSISQNHQFEMPHQSYNVCKMKLYSQSAELVIQPLAVKPAVRWQSLKVISGIYFVFSSESVSEKGWEQKKSLWAEKEKRINRLIYGFGSQFAIE